MRRASLGLIIGLVGLVLALVAVTLSTVAVTRNRAPQTITLSPNAPDKRTVSVNGTGIATLAPDLARFSVGVQEQGKNLTEVQGTVARETDAIFNALVKAGLDKDKDVKTSGYSVQPIYDYPKDKAPIVSGYRVANIVNATVRGLDKDPNKVGPIIDAAVQAGANNIGNITFTLSDPEAAGKIARDAAMKNAQGKAEALAASGNAKLGIVITVTDQSVTPAAPKDVQYAVAAPSSAAAPAPPTQISPGETNVTVTVNVTYALT